MAECKIKSYLQEGGKPDFSLPNSNQKILSFQPQVKVFILGRS